MGGNAASHRGGGVEAFSGEAAIGSEFARQPRQEPGRADVWEEADTHLWHGEGEAVAGNAVRAVHGNADPTAHHYAVNQRDVGLAVGLDHGVEAIFVAPEAERLLVSSCAPELVK